MNEFQKFGMNPIGIYEKAFPASLPWEERLAQAAIAGYDFVEMSIDVSEERLSRLEWSPSTRSALRHVIKSTGTPILTMGVSGHRDFPLGSPSQKVRARSLEILYRAIDLANDLGIKIIQLMGYDVFNETSDKGTQERFIQGLVQGTHWAGAAGVMLALENVDVDTVDSVEKALRFVKSVNSPWLNLYPDMGNLVAAGFDPVKQLKHAEGYLVGVHVKDAVPGEVRGVVFEKGIVPFNKVFQTLAEMGYSGPLAVEMWAHLDKTGDPVQAAAEAQQLVRSLLHSTARMIEGDR